SLSRKPNTLPCGGRTSGCPRSAIRRCSSSEPTRYGSRNRSPRFCEFLLDIDSLPVYLAPLPKDRLPVNLAHAREESHVAYLTIAPISADACRLLAGYRRTSELMDQVGHDHGLVLHAAAEMSNGLLIVNLWPSQAGSEAAANDPRRLAALRRGAARPRNEHQEDQHT